MTHADDELANAILDEVEKMLKRYRPDLGRAVGRLRSLAQLPPGGDYIDDSEPVAPQYPEEDEEADPELLFRPGEGHDLVPNTANLLLYLNPLPAGYGIAGTMGHIRLNPAQFTVDADGVLSLVTGALVLEAMTEDSVTMTEDGATMYEGG